MTPLPFTAAAPYRINRIYLKSASVEVPRMAELPQQAEQPHIGVDMQTSAQAAWDGALECVLRITLQGRLRGKSIFALEVSEAGVFELEGGSQEEITRFVRQVAASVLFPFARKDLAMLAVSAGFQPILLDHIDFDALLTRVIEQHRASMRTQGPTLQATLQAQRPATQAPPPEPPPVEPTEPVAPVPAAPSALPVPGAKASRRVPMAAGLLLLTLAVGLAGWYTQARRDAPLAAAPVTATPASPASAPAAPEPPPPPPLPQATQQALQASAQRLAEQPPDWFTIELGQMPAQSDLAGLAALPTDRPLYLQQSGDTTLRLLYGAFPSAQAAETALTRLDPAMGASWLQGPARITRLGPPR